MMKLWLEHIKKLLQKNKKKINNLMEKWAEGFNRSYPEKKEHITSTHMKRCIRNSVVIGEVIPH